MNFNINALEEPPAKRFKTETSNNDLNNVENQASSSINGATAPENRILISRDPSTVTNDQGIVSMLDSINSRSISGNSRSLTIPVSFFSGVVFQQPSSSQNSQGNSISLVRLQGPPVGAVPRQLTALRQTSVPTNASQLRPTSGIAINSGNAPIRMPVPGSLRNSVSLVQTVANSTLPNSVAPVLFHQSVLLQQQARPMLVVPQQSSSVSRQATNTNQTMATLVVPQVTAGNVRRQSTPNSLPPAIQQQQLQNQVVLQRLPQVNQPRQPQLVQVQVQPAVTSNAQQVQSESIPPQVAEEALSQAELLSKQKIEKIVTTQRHLLLLLHAHGCLSEEKATGISKNCPNPSCPQMRELVKHLYSCKFARNRQNCPDPRCLKSSTILNHWRSCLDQNCLICRCAVGRFKKSSAVSSAAANVSATTNGTVAAVSNPAASTSTSAPDATRTWRDVLNIPSDQKLSSLYNKGFCQGQSHFNGISKINAVQSLSLTESELLKSPETCTSSALKNERTKDWQVDVTDELRMIVVYRLTQNIFPTPDNNSLQDKRVVDAVEAAKKIESNCFKEANTREQYYQFVAERICRFKRDLQEKNKKLQGDSALSLDSSNGIAGSLAQQQLLKVLTMKKEEPEVKLENNVKKEQLDAVNSHVGNKNTPEIRQPTSGKKVWKQNELRFHLMPVLEKLYRLDPESLPFRQPVDPIQLHIPDYFDIIQKPMDLSTIKRKLDTGVYSEPWEFVNDVWLMFENAWLFNRKTSKVHKYCTKLYEVFEPEIDVVMKEIGFCCGKKYAFHPQVLCCYGKPMCTIAVGAVYYGHDSRYVYCENCFNEIKGNDVEVVDDVTQSSLIIQKSLFVKTKNSETEAEQFVNCTVCNRKQHQICSMYHEPIWPSCFVCNYCVKYSGVKRRQNKFTAKKLFKTQLGSYLENRINSFLRANRFDSGEVTIRVHSITEKAVEIKPGMRRKFCDSENALKPSVNACLPYTSKAIFAYQEIDGYDVCFFGMHVQEYGSNCPPPNTRRVYIAYLDSVNFFNPKHFRTSVYHEILIGYLDYVKNLGFTTAHIWACPPSEGDDYIFHCHPPDMKIPKPKRLADWYKRMLDKAKVEDVVIEFRDILKDALGNDMQSVTEMPYFDGDFWPNVIETCISELDQEELQRKLEAAGENGDVAVESQLLDIESQDVNSEFELNQSECKKSNKGSNGSKKKTVNKKSAVAKRTNTKVNQAYPGSGLISKLLVMMEKHKEVFFVVRLRHHIENLPPINDPDAVLVSDLMDGRDNFLMMCRERHYEFSSLRRAKHSTMVMLYELHVQAKDGFMYACNYCQANVEVHYRCTICDDFDLCVPCYQAKGHEHTMEKIGLDLEDDDVISTKISSADINGCASNRTGLVNPSQQKQLTNVLKLLETLIHVKQCTAIPTTDEPIPNCPIPGCRRAKHILYHMKVCQNKYQCKICLYVSAAIKNHAKKCMNDQCQVPFCSSFKAKATQQKYMQLAMMNRRIAATYRGVENQLFNNQSPSGVPRQAAAGSTALGQVQARQQPRGLVNNARRFQTQIASLSGQGEIKSEFPTVVSQEALQKILKSQQSNTANNGHTNAGNVLTDQQQLINAIQNNSRIQAIIKKEMSPTDASVVVELVPVTKNSQSNSSNSINSNSSNLPLSPPLNQQQQLISASSSSSVQRNMATGLGSPVVQNVPVNRSLNHFNNSNPHLMLSQSTSHVNFGMPQVKDTTLTLQDQLSRYVDQL